MRLTEITPEIEPIKKQSIMEKLQSILEDCEKLKKLQKEPLQHAKPFTSITSL